MNRNIFQQQVVPDKPKVLAEERVYVYVPPAGASNKGIVSLNQRDFSSPTGHVSLRWPMEMMIETLADPTVRPSSVKVLSDEFVHTNNPAVLTNPATGVSYESNTAEIKLNRENRDAFVRPDLVMLNPDNFEKVQVGEYNKYNIKQEDPRIKPSIVQVDLDDFNYEEDTVNINWPFAHDIVSGSSRADGYGLVKIDPNKSGNLSYDLNHNLQVDLEALHEHLAIRPAYGANFADSDIFVDPVTGLAKRDSQGNILLNITKESVGLDRVDNRWFSSRVYSEFGQSMKDHFDTRFATKVDTTTWNSVFNDWAPPSTDRDTAQKWFTRLEEEDASLWSSLGTIQRFIGIYETNTELILEYPPNASLVGAMAFITDTNTYWAIKVDPITPEEWIWYDTGLAELSFYEFVETDATKLQPNASVATVGTSGKWIQSDHIHPQDSSKLDASVFENTKIIVKTELPSSTDFEASLGQEVNIPYIRTTQYLHNWQNSVSDFIQDHNSNETYWAGSQEEFESLDIDTLPNNTFIHVTDNDYLIPGHFVTEEQLDEVGLDVNDLNYKVVTKRRTLNLENSPLTLDSVGRLTNLDFPVAGITTDPTHRDAIIMAGPNGASIYQRSFQTNRGIRSDSYGNLVASNYHSDNIVTTGNSSTKTVMTPGNLVVSTGLNSISSFHTGLDKGRPIITDGTGSIEVSSLPTNRLVMSDNYGKLVGVTWLASNIIKTSSGSTNNVDLDPGKLVISEVNNTLTTWDSGGRPGSLIVRGSQEGSIEVKSFEKAYNLLASGPQGTLTELEGGVEGDYLVKTSSGMPAWTSGPSDYETLPQTVLYNNPTDLEANSFKGLVAVVLTGPPAEQDLRNNCIYYY